jgi:hypothetical protein
LYFSSSSLPIIFFILQKCGLIKPAGMTILNAWYDFYQPFCW